MILALHALTVFVGAALLFVVEPMVGKMILPLLGGTPAVWSTCLVFFQAALLGGYLYAHALARWLAARGQALVHLVVLAVPLAVLPLAVNPRLLRGGEANPALDVLALLAASVGLPFVVVSATAPLVQTWFARTAHRAARDPYFLYAASNLGSMLALLGYPAVIEPWLPLRDAGGLSQARLWSAGYLLLAGLTAACALLLWRAAPGPADAPAGGAAAPEAPAADAVADTPVTARRRLRWVVLALVPSSLLLGVTTYVTTDLAAVPLLWVLPLAIYLLTFILAFGRWPARLQRVAEAVALPAVLGALFLVVSGYRPRLWLAVLAHFGLLFVTALTCHGAVALDRPAPRRLTEFYLLVSLGGVLGGLVNALVAPVIFSGLIEYPLMMVAAAVVVVERGPARGRGRRLIDAALALAVIALALVCYSRSLELKMDLAFLTRALGLGEGRVKDWLDLGEELANRLFVYAPPLVAAYLLRRRRLALGLALAGTLVATGFVDTRGLDELFQARSFFGVLRVSHVEDGVDPDKLGYTELRHGTTLHGRQSRDPARRAEPVSYYHRTGPIGQVVVALQARTPVLRMGVVGLGTGGLAAYARPGDATTFYEIDRLVRDIAIDRGDFTFVLDARARGARVRIELGDARLRMEVVGRERPGELYDLIAVDAFSSDAIPVHLITREALRVYLSRLAPGGVVAFHISNRHLRLEPVVARLAEDAGLGGRLLQHDDSPEEEGADRSTWAVLARRLEDVADLAARPEWQAVRLETEPRVGVWTDDFHNLLSVFKWR